MHTSALRAGRRPTHRRVWRLPRAGDLDTKNTVDIMDLLLSINQNEGITCVMVTHNPDLECYADRILYVADGMVRSVRACLQLGEVAWLE